MHMCVVWGRGKEGLPRYKSYTMTSAQTSTLTQYILADFLSFIDFVIFSPYILALSGSTVCSSHSLLSVHKFGISICSSTISFMSDVCQQS